MNETLHFTLHFLPFAFSIVDLAGRLEVDVADSFDIHLSDSFDIHLSVTYLSVIYLSVFTGSDCHDMDSDCHDMDSADS